MKTRTSKTRAKVISKQGQKVTTKPASPKKRATPGAGTAPKTKPAKARTAKATPKAASFAPKEALAFYDTDETLLEDALNEAGVRFDSGTSLRTGGRTLWIPLSKVNVVRRIATSLGRSISLRVELCTRGYFAEFEGALRKAGVDAAGYYVPATGARVLYVDPDDVKTVANLVRAANPVLWTEGMKPLRRADPAWAKALRAELAAKKPWKKDRRIYPPQFD